MPRLTNSTRRRQSRCKGIALVVTTIVTIIGGLVAAVAVLVLWRSPLPAVTAQAASSADQKLESVHIPSGSRLISLTQDEVNSVLRDRLQKSGQLVDSDANGVHDVRVALNGNDITAFITLGQRGTELTVELEGKLYSQGQYLRFDPISCSIGALTLPRPLLASAMRNALNDREEKLRLPPDVSELRVENGRVLLR